VEQQDPALAIVFHKWIASLTAERLADMNNTLAALID
jgi:hypothetical protein